ncbi:MAG: hypothetical protein JNM00_15675, partial [Flavobacteriales bacterium]|nr:hypothetical protein [Flavobacteriales bacterium]
MSFRKLLLTKTLIAAALCSGAQIQNLFFSAYDNIVRLDFTGGGEPQLVYTGIANGFEAIAHAEDQNG